MSSRFYNILRLGKFKTIVVTGIGNREQLINQLSSEAVKAGRKSLIAADSKLMYPPEGQFQLGNDPRLLFRKAQEKENEGPLFLASDLRGDHLLPFRGDNIAAMPGWLEPGSLLFLFVESRNKALLHKIKKSSHILIICTIDFEPIKGDLLDARMNQAVDDSAKEKQVLREIENLMNSICQSDQWTEVSDRFVLFVNRINDLFDENLFIPVGRYLRQKGMEQVYYGSLQNYEIKAI
jgi:hypothetical protein